MAESSNPAAPLYLCGMAIGVWVGAVTTLLGAVIGGAISFVLSRQQIKASRIQREADRAHENYQRSVDRRFQVYSDFLIRSRSFRNALKAYYLPSDHRPSIEAIDDILRSAQDAAALVFLMVESDDTYYGCVLILRALGAAQAVVQGLRQHEENPWRKLNLDLGRALRKFQTAARNELEVKGPTRPWVVPKDNLGQQATEQDGVDP